MRAEDDAAQTAEDLSGSEHDQSELGTLFAAARTLNSADLGAADRFLAGWVVADQVVAEQHTVQPLTRLAATDGARQRHAFRVWASAALGLAAALGGLLVLRPAVSPGDLPASAAYSVYQSALGDGW